MKVLSLMEVLRMSEIKGGFLSDRAVKIMVGLAALYSVGALVFATVYLLFGWA